MKTLQLRNSINRSHCRRGFLLTSLLLACVALSPSAFAEAKSTKWTQIGTGARPDSDTGHNICGCIIQAAWSHDNVGQNRDVLWMGTGSGGLWKSKVDSTGAIKKWIPLTDNFPGPHGMGSFIVNRTDSNKILIGPGGFGAGSGVGDGKIYRTTDQGGKWTGYALPDATPKHINRIVEDRSDPKGNKVLACTSNGIFRSIDFGNSWEHTYTLSEVTDIVQDTGDPSKWYAGALNDHGILRSTDGGVIWKPYPGNGVIAGSIGRVSLAACAKDPNVLVLYALVATEKGTNDDADEPDGGLLNGLYRSPDRGETWIPILTSDDNDRINPDNQALHTCAIACDPADPGHIIFGMAKPLEAFNATASIAWHEFDGGHMDYNFFLFRPGFHNIVIANDGGYYTYTYIPGPFPYIPEPSGFSLLDDSGNLLGIEANHITGKVKQGGLASSYTDPAEFLAGVQHNGVLRGNATTGRITQVYGGDGGQVSIMPLNSDVLAVSNNKKRAVFVNSSWSDITKVRSGDDKYPTVLIDPTPHVSSPKMSRKMFTYAQTEPVPPSNSILSYIYFRDVFDVSSSWQVGAAMHGNPYDIAGFGALPGAATHLDHTANQNRHDIPVTLKGDRQLYLYTGKQSELGSLTLTTISETQLGLLDLQGKTVDARANADRSNLQPDTIYYTTGTARPSQALLSTNAGKTWKDVTANLPTDSSGPDFNKLIGNPKNLKDLFLATSAGVYRTNANGDWHLYSTGLRLNEEVQDIVINTHNVTTSDALHRNQGQRILAEGDPMMEPAGLAQE